MILMNGVEIGYDLDEWAKAAMLIQRELGKDLVICPLVVRQVRQIFQQMKEAGHFC